MKKVLIIIITKDHVEKDCMDSVLVQNYPETRIMVSIMKPHFPNIKNLVHSKYLNCSAHREEARVMALGSVADYFLFIDSDVVLPNNATEEFIKQPFDVQGGWYKILSSDRWVAGKWISDNVVYNFKAPDESIIKADFIGMGCAFFSREVLTKIKFEHGLDWKAMNETGTEVLLGECGIAGNRIFEAGYQSYMNGNVICGHLERK